MQETKARPYISASIRAARLLQESAEILQNDLSGTVSLEMRDSSIVETRWEQLPNSKILLAVIPNIDVIFIEKSSGNTLVNYKSCHDLRFEVEAFTGFDPEKDLPQEAVSPYIEMAMWIVRAKAQNSVRSMGMSQFTWPQGVISQMESPLRESPKPEKLKKPRASKRKAL